MKLYTLVDFQWMSSNVIFVTLKLCCEWPTFVSMSEKETEKEGLGENNIKMPVEKTLLQQYVQIGVVVASYWFISITLGRLNN